MSARNPDRWLVLKRDEEANGEVRGAHRVAQVALHEPRNVTHGLCGAFLRRLWVCAGLLLSVARVSEVQATQPLPEFLERAKTQSFDARESSARREERVAEADLGLGRLLPALNARAQYARNQSEVTVQFPGSTQRILLQRQNQLDGVLQLDVPLIDLPAYHRYRAASALAHSAASQEKASRAEIAKAVSATYFEFIGASALAQSARESVTSAQANLRLVATRKGAGAATDLDAERARANAERAERDLADSELARTLSARRLETLTGLSPSPVTEFPVDDLHAEGPLSHFSGQAGSTPADRAAQDAAEAADEQQRAADSAFLPTVALSAQEHFTNATGFSGKSQSYALQLTALWQLDYGTIATSRALSASARVEQVRLERARRAVADDIFEAYQRIDAGIAKSRAARAQVSAARRAARLSSERYLAGAATQLDVTEAQRDEFLAQTSRIQADADLAYARASLRLTAGLPDADAETP